MEWEKTTLSNHVTDMQAQTFLSRESKKDEDNKRKDGFACCSKLDFREIIEPYKQIRESLGHP